MGSYSLSLHSSFVFISTLGDFHPNKSSKDCNLNNKCTSPYKCFPKHWIQRNSNRSKNRKKWKKAITVIVIVYIIYIYINVLIMALNFKLLSHYFVNLEYIFLSVIGIHISCRNSWNPILTLLMRWCWRVQWCFVYWNSRVLGLIVVLLNHCGMLHRWWHDEIWLWVGHMQTL